jgi:hypothetical protein
MGVAQVGGSSGSRAASVSDGYRLATIALEFDKDPFLSEDSTCEPSGEVPVASVAVKREGPSDVQTRDIPRKRPRFFYPPDPENEEDHEGRGRANQNEERGSKVSSD